MSNDVGGGTAFPASGEGNWAPTPGMSLRDWFAGQALMGMISGAFSPPYIDGMAVQDSAAMAAYIYADAILRQRLKEVTG